MEPFWQGKQVCVTGGGGFLGFHLVKLLQNAGAQVRVLCLPPRDGHPLNECPNVERFYGDLLNVNLTRQAVDGCDVVFHTAAIVATWGLALKRMERVNVEGTQIVLDAARGRVVHTSSVVAVGANRAGQVFDEETPYNLANLDVDYVRTKRRAEEIALEHNDRDVVVVNPGYLIGPEDYEGSVMTRLFQRYWRGALMALPPGGYSLVDVRDVARGHMLAAELGARGRRYILAGENLAWPQLAERLWSAASYRPRWVPSMPLWSMHAAAHVCEWRASYNNREPYPSIQQTRMQQFKWFYNSSRARAELGYRARPIDETLGEMYRWMQEERPKTLRGFNRWYFRPAA